MSSIKLLPSTFKPTFFKGERAFTLVELLFIIFLVGMLLAMAFPYVESMLDDSAYVKCSSQLEMIRRAKTSYVIDHLGMGCPTNASDIAVFNTYFPETFPFVCPRDGKSLYDANTVYNVFALTICPYCSTHPPNGVKEWNTGQ